MIKYCTRGWCNDCKSRVLFVVDEDGVRTCTECDGTTQVCAKCYGSGWFQKTDRDEYGRLLFHISIPCPDCTNKQKEGGEE